MAGATTNNEIQVEYSIFSDVWRLYKTNCYVSDDKAYWENVINEARVIERKYNSNNLCNDLLIAVITELENNHKNRERG